MTTSEYKQALLDSLSKARLVPGPASTVIPADFSPAIKLGITFQNTTVTLGTFLRAGVAKQPPAVSLTPLDGNDASNAFFTLAMFDPDAPTPDDPKFAFWRHWVVPGLKASAAGDGAVGWTKDAVTAYLGPGPKDE
jgi:phosphatidylethanolamine-binding protein